jgi:dihydrofolate reductase
MPSLTQMMKTSLTVTDSTDMKLSMIAAVALNNIIGRTNGDRTQDIPWRLKSDMRYFKTVTMGKPMIMGRKTWETFGGKPLPGRPHIVITRSVAIGRVLSRMGDMLIRDLDPVIAEAIQEKLTDVMYVGCLEDAFLVANKLITNFEDPEIIVIGGGQIYAEAIDYCNRMYITQVYKEPKVGDVYFPTFGTEWTEASRSRHNASSELDNECHFDFVIYVRHGKIPKPFLHDGTAR